MPPSYTFHENIEGIELEYAQNKSHLSAALSFLPYLEVPD